MKTPVPKCDLLADCVSYDDGTSVAHSVKKEP
jgi:hypothetical protein